MATLSGAERFPSSYSSPTCRRRSRPFRRVFPWIVCVAYVDLCVITVPIYNFKRQRLLLAVNCRNGEKKFLLYAPEEISLSKKKEKSRRSFLEKLVSQTICFLYFTLRATLQVTRNLRFLCTQSEETSIIVTIITNALVKQWVYVPRDGELWKLDICDFDTAICRKSRKNIRKHERKH